MVLYTSHERRRFSDTSLDCLVENLRKMRPGATFLRYDLRDCVREFLTEENAYDPGPEIKAIGDAILSSDLLIIGSPILNFTYSPYLHTFFQRLRHVFVTLDEGEKVVERNMKGVRAVIVLTGRSSLIKWYLITRFVVMAQFKLVFCFWGGKVIAYRFIPNCRKNNLESSRKRIAKIMEKFAGRVGRHIN